MIDRNLKKKCKKNKITFDGCFFLRKKIATFETSKYRKNNKTLNIKFMKFVVSSTELVSHLQAISRVINPKNTLPILDNFLFDLQDNELTITASDLDSTLITSLIIDNSQGGGKIAIEAKRLTDILKEFPEQPLTFDINMENMAVDILSENGKFSVVGQDGDDFPRLSELKEELAHTVLIGASVLLRGINKSVFATADDELRPVMNGVFFQTTPEHTSFVASDSHKLVRYRRYDIKSNDEASFILPKKPALLLKNILAKESDDVKIQFDGKNAFFELTNYKLVCRLIEGQYPAYETVIPTSSPNKMIVDRLDFYNSLKRVSVFSNQASNLIKLKMDGNQLLVSAQDIDFSISAYERINCEYNTDEMEIGFKSSFLIQIVDNLPASDIALEMADPSRATLLLPVDKEDDNEDIMMLLMPMMIHG